MEEMIVQREPEMWRQLHEVAEQEGSAEIELIREALARYLQDEAQRFPRSIGMGEDGELTGETCKDWLHAQWDRKWAEG